MGRGADVAAGAHSGDGGVPGAPNGDGLGIRRLDEVTTYVIQKYVNDLSGRLKPRTVKNYATSVTGFFNANAAYDWPPENLAGIGRDLEVEVARGAGGGQATRSV